MRKLINKSKKNSENIKSEFDMQQFFEIATEDELLEYSVAYSEEVIKRVLQNLGDKK